MIPYLVTGNYEYVRKRDSFNGTQFGVSTLFDKCILYHNGIWSRKMSLTYNLHEPFNMLDMINIIYFSIL